MTMDKGSLVLLPGEGTTVRLPGNEITLMLGRPDGAYSLVEWVSAPGVPGTPLHIHRITDEAFYVLEGTFGFQVGERTVDGAAGAFFYVPKGLEHAFWNQGPTPARMLIMISPPGFERYFEELAEGLASAGEDEEAAMSVRKTLSEKHDIEVVGPPHQATG
jgi:mannose-6-phosphate isomerase-like protein (cupin superfamily)